MDMIDVMDLLPAIGILFPFFLCQVPVGFRYDGFVFPIIHRELLLFNHMHLIPGADLLFCPSSAVCDLAHIDRIINYLFYEVI